MSYQNYVTLLKGISYGTMAAAIITAAWVGKTTYELFNAVNTESEPEKVEDLPEEKILMDHPNKKG